MESSASRFKKYIFVCENDRPEGDCCMPAGAEIREKLKSRVKAMGKASLVRVSRAGCLDVCAEGPNVLVMPDNIWFKKVSSNDLDVILREALGGL